MATEKIQVAGISFRPAEEIGQLRPVGACTVEWDKENKHDPNAIKVIWEGHHLGFIPAPKQDKPSVQPEVLAMLKNGETPCVEVKDYAYKVKGEKKWNKEHRGNLASVTLLLCTEGDGNYRNRDGKSYERISHLVGSFSPDGIDALLGWATQFRHKGEYTARMNELAEAGTAMHSSIEAFYKGETAGLENLPTNFGCFTSKYEIEPISMEERLWDDELRITGRFDLFAKVNGVLMCPDWKSSKAVRLKHKLQGCTYSYLKAMEVGEDVLPMVVAFGAQEPEVWTGTWQQVEDGYQIVRHLAECKQLAGNL